MASQQLPTRAHATSIHATTAGLLVRTGDRLRLYSTDFVELRQTTIGDIDRDSIDVVTTSPSGRTILLNGIGQTFSRLQVLDGSTLKSKQSWTQSPPLRRLYTISDTGISAADFNQEHILFTNFGTRKWTVVAGQSELKCVGLPTLVTNNTIGNSCKPLSYLSTTGSLIFRDTFQKNESLEQKTAIAQRGAVMAVSINRRKGSDFWDTGSGLQVAARYVVVYDLKLQKRIFELELIPLPQNDLDFGLSPDGSRLAVLSDKRVTVCSVPVQHTSGEGSTNGNLHEH